MTTYFGALLFTPADRPDRFQKGAAVSRGALVLDLEDGVRAERKGEARVAVREWLKAGSRSLIRLNAPHSQEFDRDVAELGSVRPHGIMVAKVESEESLATVRAVWPEAWLYPLIESPRGLLNLLQISHSRNVVQLCLGMLDLAAACRVTQPHRGFTEYARIQLALASAGAGLAGPLDTPFPGFVDRDAIADDAKAAAELGFFGKLCIHPAQLEPTRAAFRPSEEELSWAREVVAAGQAGGATSVRGAMVDAPVVERARQIIDRDRRTSRADGAET